MTTLYGCESMLSGGCGVHNFHLFREAELTRAFRPLSSFQLGGANLGVACFINTPECEKAYTQLKEKFNIVYQSEPRKNKNSGRQFFMVVYDGVKK